jgi:peptide/nickel transport system ATP-binding protein
MRTEASKQGRNPAIYVRGLRKQYWLYTRPWKRQRLSVVEGISFDLLPGQTLGLVGPSGCGKSTLARCVTRLDRPDAGEIWVDGINIAAFRSRELLPYRRQIQMIFQDPSTAMNPRMSAAQIIEEPLQLQRRQTRQARRSRAAEMMLEVGLSPDWMDRRITEFSGGQRQRLAVARALLLGPRVLVLDEALSGLDLSTQAQIANLLLDLQATHSLSYILISHDLSLVAHMADRIAVMSSGKIVEQGLTNQVISQPAHPVTQSLLEAAQRLPFRTAAAGDCR